MGKEGGEVPDDGVLFWANISWIILASFNIIVLIKFSFVPLFSIHIVECFIWLFMIWKASSLVRVPPLLLATTLRQDVVKRSSHLFDVAFFFIPALFFLQSMRNCIRSKVLDRADDAPMGHFSMIEIWHVSFSFVLPLDVVCIYFVFKCDKMFIFCSFHSNSVWFFMSF